MILQKIDGRDDVSFDVLRTIRMGWYRFTATQMEILMLDTE